MRRTSASGLNHRVGEYCDSNKKQQRRAVNSAAAPAYGLGRPELDIALMLADGSKKGEADLAFAAHTGVISHWAQAGWNERLPFHELQTSFADARARAAEATQPWRIVYGPAFALVCTLQRLNWTISSATELVADKGRILDITVEPRSWSPGSPTPRSGDGGGGTLRPPTHPCPRMEPTSSRSSN